MSTGTERAAMDDFLWRALIGGFAVAVVAGPLGAFVVWRRKAYFGDTLAHAALLGVALGLLLGTNVSATILSVCFAVAVLLVILQHRLRLGADTLLGIMAHGGLALGLVALAFAKAPSVDLMSYLVGDILAVSRGDIVWALVGGGAALAAVVGLWRPLVSATVNEELASVEGVPVTLVSVAFMLLLAIVVALAMKIVGILLVTALLIIPAAAARPFARTPEEMAVLAAGAGCLAVGGGLAGAFHFDTPAGPTIVVAALFLFGLASLKALATPRR
jgi:zinc transport system permease protein